MRRSLTSCCFLVWLVLSCQTVQGHQESTGPGHRADWLAEARWGLFVHYLAATVAEGDDTTVDQWNQAVDSFDTDAYAEQLAKIGANYTCITLGQNSGHFIAPNATYDQLEALGKGLAQPRPMTPPGNLASFKPAKLLDLSGRKILAVNGAKQFARHGVDGDAKTIAQAGGDWPWTYQVDLLEQAQVDKIVVAFPEEFYPTEYNILVAADGGNGEDWKIVAHETGHKLGQTTHKFKPTLARFIRVHGLKPDGPNQPGGQMAIAELEAYATGRTE